VRYRTFKDVRFSKKSLTIFMALCVFGLVIANRLHPAYVLVAYFAAYLLLGLVETAISLGSRRRVVAAGSAQALLDDDDDDEEDEPGDEELEGQDFL
jgi:CDP-diacylglycerol--serine O-phosphatidyltransferase